MNNIASIETDLNRRIGITMNRDGSGHISLTNTEFGEFVQARLTKSEVDKLREALKVEISPDTIRSGQRMVVIDNNGHRFDIGDIVAIKHYDHDGTYLARRIRDGFEQYITARDLKRVSATAPKFSEDDTVVVSGDCNEDYPHKYPVGTKVRIVEHRDMDGDYWVEDEDTGYSAYVFEGDMKAAPKFAEGDRVRVIGNSRIMHHFEIGDIVTVCEDSYGDVIECMKTRPNGRPLFQGVSVEDLELFTGPDLVEGDVYLDDDLDPWTVRNGVLAYRDGMSCETWEDVEESYGPLKKVAGWHVVLPNGEKVKGLSTAGPELFSTKEGAERLAESRVATLKDLGAVVATPARVEPVFV